MLSTQAFNGLLKTLEEPPPHVKFIFATTEIRKVPITVLSRCQRFDLRRVDAEHAGRASARHRRRRKAIAVDDDALAMIARAAEGSVRDALSILDQAIAHGAGAVTAEAVRAMLGLADRARIVDLFEHLMKGDVAAALDEFRAQYDAGADPVAVLTDLAEFTHLVTRLRFVPAAANDASLSRGRAAARRRISPRRCRSGCCRAPGRCCSRASPRCRRSNRPVSAAEMVLIRHRPCRRPADAGRGAEVAGDGSPASAGAACRAMPAPRRLRQPGNGANAVRQIAHADDGTGGGQTMRLVEAAPQAGRVHGVRRRAGARQAPAVPVRSLADIVALADTHRDKLFKVSLKQYVRLVRHRAGPARRRADRRCAEDACSTT